MTANRTVLLSAALLLAVGCRHHTLTPKLGGRPTESMRAEANKTEGGWVVTLPLPLGTWIPKAVGEDQPMEVVTLDGKATARWRVSPERWAHSDRPFAFVLVSPDGLNIEMSVTYTLFSRGAQFWLWVLRGNSFQIRLP